MMSEVVEQVKNPYSRLVSWEVWNFMSIEHGKCEFDERNIVNLKGYNDSGKSAMLTALKVLMSNSNSTKQVSFIRDNTEYFRILATFDDGVRILRDKYINGQSLYEMYKGNECIYSTKSNTGALSRVTEVPQPISDYLGLIMYDGVCLNSRSCFEKQIGVQTTGSENYKMFNTVLKSEELASASAMFNNDKNKLVADINSLDSEISANKSLLGVGQYVTEDMISYLKEHDSKLDGYEIMLEELTRVGKLATDLSKVYISPEIQYIDTSDLSMLKTVETLIFDLNRIKINPEVEYIDNSHLVDLGRLMSLVNSLNNVKIAPEVRGVSLEQLSCLTSIKDIFKSISECDDYINSCSNKLEDYSSELSDLESKLSVLGIKMVKCPNCGHMFEGGGAE